MANVLNRTTKQYLTSVNTPDYPVIDWIINPDVSAVAAYPTIYWKIAGDLVSLQTPQEQLETDDALFEALIQSAEGKGEIFGDGNDGDITEVVNRTLSQDLYARRYVIEPGVVINTAGFRIFAKKGIINKGTIRNNGNSAVLEVGGTGAPTGTLVGGASGATGNNGNGVNGDQFTGLNIIGHGGRGGDGGTGLAGTAGLGGGVISNNNARVRPRRFEVISLMADIDASLVSPHISLFGGGAGGGSGGGNGAARLGGGGGGGGGIVLIVAPFIFNASNATIEARGGDGGAANGNNSGGGGGGGGGIIATITGDLRERGSRIVTGGAGGLNTGSGTPGAAGNAGRTINVKVG